MMYLIGYDRREKRIVTCGADEPGLVIASWNIEDFKTWKDLKIFLGALWCDQEKQMTKKQSKMLLKKHLQLFPFKGKEKFVSLDEIYFSVPSEPGKKAPLEFNRSMFELEYDYEARKVILYSDDGVLYGWDIEIFKSWQDLNYFLEGIMVFLEGSVNQSLFEWLYKNFLKDDFPFEKVKEINKKKIFYVDQKFWDEVHAK